MDKIELYTTQSMKCNLIEAKLISKKLIYTRYDTIYDDIILKVNGKSMDFNESLKYVNSI